MLNDRQASELISKSLRTDLSAREAAEVNQHLAENTESQTFARISRLIQNSLADIAVMSQDGDTSIAPGLSANAKQKMQKSIRNVSRRIDAEPEGAEKLTKRMFDPDTLLAMSALDRGMITEEELVEIVKRWKPADAGSLGLFLLSEGVCDENQLLELQEQVDNVLALDAPGDTDDVYRERVNSSDSLRRIGDISDSVIKDREEKPRSDVRHVVSRFTLIRKLGEGGLGSVWLARDEKLKRTVAIKEINTDAAESAKASQRFHREAEITGFLEHPNVVPLYQYGSDPKTGQPFYAMRFVGKRTLAEAIIEYHEKRKAGMDVKLELRRLLDAFLDVCQAIAYAHSRGVIHRDLKPENVALDNYGQVIVLDWGLAKLTDQAELITNIDVGSDSDEGNLARTVAGEVVGTPLYMAPEQAAGDLDNIDEKTDVFGLGAILFSILTGTAPHADSHFGQTPEPTIKKVLEIIAEKDAPRPRDFVGNIPVDLEAACIRAMSKTRFKRQASALELATEVERWLAGQTEKQQEYDNMRMEGREMRAKLQSSVSDLCTNARFMSNLPPIQEIIGLKSNDAQSDDELNAWRDRLAVIYCGLLRANRDYSRIGYCQVANGECSEIVRVERHSTDEGNVRAVPLSRLGQTDFADFDQSVIQQNPDEVYVMLIAEADEINGFANRKNRKIRAGVPVYDEQTEEPFGFVWIESELQKVIERETRNRVQTAKQIVFVDQDLNIWLHDSVDSGIVESSSGKSVHNLCPALSTIVEHLQLHSEFICEGDRDKYATRLELGRSKGVLYFVLTQRGYETKNS